MARGESNEDTEESNDGAKQLNDDGKESNGGAKEADDGTRESKDNAKGNQTGVQRASNGAKGIIGPVSVLHLSVCDFTSLLHTPAVSPFIIRYPLDANPPCHFGSLRPYHTSAHLLLVRCPPDIHPLRLLFCFPISSRTSISGSVSLVKRKTSRDPRTALTRRVCSASELRASSAFSSSGTINATSTSARCASCREDRKAEPKEGRRE